MEEIKENKVEMQTVEVAVGSEIIAPVLSMKQSMVNGNIINHMDIIHHSTNTVFGFKDRLRILFGKVVYVHSKIYTKHTHCIILASEANANVEHIFKKKQKGLVEQSPEIKKEV